MYTNVIHLPNGTVNLVHNIHVRGHESCACPTVVNGRYSLAHMEEIFCLLQCLLFRFHENRLHWWLLPCIMHLELGVQQEPVDQRRSHLMGATHLRYRSKCYFLSRVYLVQDVKEPA
jgi:hypothetical protein